VSNFRFPPAEKQRWAQAARKEGLSLTAWIRARANEYVCADGTVIDALGNFKGIDQPQAARNLREVKP
jgi:hypothetical protein